MLSSGYCLTTGVETLVRAKLLPVSCAWLILTACKIMIAVISNANTSRLTFLFIPR